ncbi:MAG: hypothetical protein ABW168_09070 [Sedimenticola sp.]
MVTKNTEDRKVSWIKTPLHLFGFIALIAEAIVISIPVWSDLSPAHQFYLAIAAIGLLLVIIIVSAMIYIPVARGRASGDRTTL